MKSRALLLFVISTLIFGSFSCSSAPSERMGSTSPAAPPQSVKPAAETGKVAAKTFITDNYGQTQQVSLTDGERIEQVSAAADRKIIRNADLTIEVASPADTQHRIVSIAEAHGGFVVTSEAKQREGSSKG